jgi:hypothetical protein
VVELSLCPHRRVEHMPRVGWNSRGARSLVGAACVTDVTDAFTSEKLS